MKIKKCYKKVNKYILLNVEPFFVIYIIIKKEIKLK